METTKQSHISGSHGVYLVIVVPTIFWNTVLKFFYITIKIHSLCRLKLQLMEKMEAFLLKLHQLTGMYGKL